MSFTGTPTRAVVCGIVVCLVAAAAVVGARATRAARAGGTVSEQGIAPVDPSNPMRVQILGYDDAEGYLEFTAQGNRGSHFTVRMTFRGFSVLPQLAASIYKSRSAIPPGSDMLDSYYIVPRDLKVTTDIKGTYRHETQVRGFTTRVTVEHQVNHEFTIRVPGHPLGPMPIQDALRWYGSVVDAQPRNDPNYQCVIRVADRSPAGGPTTVDVQMSLGLEAAYRETIENNIPGSKSPRTSQKRGKYELRFHASGDTRRYVQAHTRSWPSLRYSTSAMQITEPISWQDLRFVVSTSDHVPHAGHPTYGTLVSDTDYTMTGTLRIGPTKPLGVYLEPVADDEARRMPEPGQAREYTVTVEDENLKDVDGLRVTLSETTSHPGVATNGGNHVRGATCSDCKAGRAEAPWKYSGTFTDALGKAVSYTRSFRHYSACPIDSMPDVFFRSTDNAGWTFSQEAIAASAALQYTAAQQMTRDGPPEKETRFTIRLMDGAASSHLSAEVRIAGVWYPVVARGPTADPTGVFLMVPLDANRDGVHDEWARAYLVTNVDDDTQDEPPGETPGDGLSVFEEYRGVFTHAVFRRLWPDVREVFIHDYSGVLGPAMNQASAYFGAANVQLIVLGQDEFKNDVINYQADSPHRQGLQYILVVMSLDQLPGAELEWAGGKASHIGPPMKDANTIVVATGRVVGDRWTAERTSLVGALVAHETGHQVNMQHHGDGEGMREIEGNRAWVACVNGQHSGNETCIMRYFGAKYLFAGRPVPDPLQASPVASGQIAPFVVTGHGTLFCKTPTGGSACKDALPGRGSCLTRIRVRSY